MIEIKSLYKTFNTKQGKLNVLQDINLTIADSDIYGIIGMSGAGKSTLVRCINLLERPSAGSIFIDGVDITGYTGKALHELRKKIGMVFQSFNLLMQKNIIENVTFPLEIAGGYTKAERIERAKWLLNMVGLSERAEYYPSQLSGGQQQRVSIARALANHPSILLCDEPTSALDSLTTNSILKLLRDINAQLGVTIVIITHEIGVVEKICNKVAVIESSEIVEAGDKQSVLTNPQHIITKQLLGKVRWDA